MESTAVGSGCRSRCSACALHGRTNDVDVGQIPFPPEKPVERESQDTSERQRGLALDVRAAAALDVRRVPDGDVGQFVELA